MRDFLSYDPRHEKVEAPDPVARARELSRQDLPKRFYAEVSVAPGDASHRVLLDGRPVRTPAKRYLELPRADLAEAVAAEWRAQDGHVDPRRMPYTRLANSVVDGVAERMSAVADDILAFAGSDLVCYRASDPARLADRQTEAWDPLLDWIEETFGARFLVGEGVMPVAQDAESVAALAPTIRGLDPWRLAGLHSITTLTGSVVVALAVLQGRLDAEAAWAAATIDECWNMELWGEDEEAVARLAQRRREFDVALDFVRDGR